MEIPDEIVVPSSELEKLRERAFAGLERNCVPVFGSGGKRVLTEGGIYTGIWLECGPHESLTLAPFLPEEERAKWMLAKHSLAIKSSENA